MNGPSRFQKLWIGIVSFVLSLLLFLQVTAIQDQIRQQEFSVRAQLRNMPAGLVPITPSVQIKAVAEGMESRLKGFVTDEWSAYVDMSQARVGVYDYPIRLSGPANPDISVRPAFKRISIEVARRAEIEVPVTIEERGRPPVDLNYAGATSSPGTVRISGAEPIIKRVKRVRAWLDLASLKPGLAPESTVEVLDGEGRIVSNIDIPQSRVNIQPKVSAAPASVDVPINVKWKGQPKLGYEIVDFSVEPKVVRLTGKGAAIGLSKSIATEPVDLSTLVADKTITVKLVVPEDVRADRASVAVSVRIQKVVIPNAPIDPQRQEDNRN